MLGLLWYFPGRIAVRAGRLAEGWDAAGRFVLCVAASLAIAPVVLNPLWHVSNNPWFLLAAIWVLVTAGVWLAERRGPDEIAETSHAAPPLRLFDRRSTRVAAAAIVALVAFATIGPYWPTELRGYPVPSLIHDFVKHHAVLFSLEQRPLPLGDPFYADDATGPVWYYHFFYLIPATVRAVAAGLSIEAAFGLASAAVGISTAAMFYVIVKRFTGSDGPAILSALLATAVGGLDIVPVLLLRQPVITLDAWADPTFRIHNFLTQMMWSPQNVSGVLIVLVGVYVLSLKGWWRGWFVLAPLLGAAVVGSSIWIAMAALAGLTLFIIADVISQDGSAAGMIRRTAASCGVGVLMLAVCAPSLRGYAEMSHRIGKGLTTQWPYQSHALLGRLVPAGVLANLLDLPWVLGLELGAIALFPLLLPRSVWRRAWRDAGIRFLLISGIVAIAGFVTLRSYFTYNDFGQKTIMVAMAGGVILAGCLAGERGTRVSLLNPLGWSLPEGLSPGRRTVTACVMGAVLVAGLPVSLYEAPLTAARRYLPASGPLGRIAHRDAARTAEEGAAYRWLRYDLPPGAVIQADWGDGRVTLVQIARRQFGVAILQEDTLVFTPADVRGHERCLAEVSASLSGGRSAEECHATLRRHGITHVFIGVIERQQWKGTERFDNDRYFERVFRRDGVQIVRLK